MVTADASTGEVTLPYAASKIHIGLAYELVINSDPCIAYLMEENSVTLQALVIAHACFGHKQQVTV